MEKILFIIGTIITFNCSAQWLQTSLDSTNVNCITLSGNNIYIGTDGNGVYYSSNDGNNWFSASTGLANLYIKALAINGNNIFAGTNTGVYLSSNYGNSWNAVNTGLTYTNINTLAIIGNNIFAGTNIGVFLSTNYGNNWIAVNTGLTSIFITSLTVCGNNLFAGTTNGLFFTSNNGTTWSSAGLQNNWITKLTSNSNIVYAVNNHNNVSVSSNNGNSWAQYSTNFGAIYSLVADSNIILASTLHEVYISLNNGSSWINANNGIPLNYYVKAIAKKGNSIYIGSQDSGVLKRSLIINVNNKTICAGSSTTLTVTQILGNESGTSFLWSNGLTGSTITVSPIVTTTYSVTGNTNDSLFDIAQSIVTVIPSPSVEAGNNQTVCNGTSIKLYANGSGSIEWDNEIVQNVSFIPDTSSIYIATATLSNGCKATDSVFVTVNPIPPTPAIHINGDSLTSNATDGIQWYKNDSPIPFAHGQSYKATTRGNYYVIVTQENCPSDTSNNIYYFDYIALFPSFITNYFTIETPLQSEMDIFNLQGILIKSFKNNDFQTTIDISNFAQGLYFIRVTTPKRTEVKKFVKE